MRLSTRVLSITLAFTITFALLIMLFIFQYATTVTVTTQYSQEIQPAREVIEHLLTTMYSDFLLVEEYLLVTNYKKLEQYDNELSHSQERCEELTDEMDDLIELSKVTNEKAVESYETAIVVYGSWQNSRDRLLALQKEQIATRKILRSEIEQERERFIILMQNATNHFTTSLEELTKQEGEFQVLLNEKTKGTQSLIVAILGLFVILSIGSSYLLTKKLTQPLDELSKASISFTKGDYSVRIKETSNIVELSALQQQLNRVYDLIETTFKTNTQKKRAAQKLLPLQYKEMLDFVKESNQIGTAITIKDVKQKFSLTHPTAISRLRYLEQNGYIEMKKEGRNKYIYEI